MRVARAATLHNVTASGALTPSGSCAHRCLGADAPHRAGLGAALLTMTPGERALVRVDAGGAYGEAGNFSFPAVAPHAALLYDVELLAAEHATEAHDVKARCGAVCVACARAGVAAARFAHACRGGCGAARSER